MEMGVSCRKTMLSVDLFNVSLVQNHYNPYINEVVEPSSGNLLQSRLQVQGYLTDKKTHPPRTLQQAYA